MTPRPAPDGAAPMITTDDGLQELVRTARAAGTFGIDMEFQRERTYYAKLCLIQTAVPAGDEREDLALIDPFEVRDLAPLWELVADPSVEVILHAGDQDMEIVFQESGLVPKNVFDTQIGAALLGYGDQPGYATLVDRILGIRLSKLETVTDWSRRPLTDGQVRYALDDVLYLYPVRRHLDTQLAERGRSEWAVEEMKHYEDRATYEKDPDRLYLRLPRTRSLSRRALAVARELAAWREAEAMRRNIPRGRVVADEVLVEIARRMPKKKADLSILRGLHPKEVERSGEDLLQAVARGTACPEAELPELPEMKNEDPDASIAVDLMEVLLRARARENGIAPSYLGTRRDMAKLLESVRDGAAEKKTPTLLSGWRRRLVGDDLVRLVRGETSLHMDPESGDVTTTDR